MRIACITNLWADCTAVGTLSPSANLDAIADANVQPVPCKLDDSTRIDLNSETPSESTRTSTSASSRVSRCPPLTTTASAPISRNDFPAVIMSSIVAMSWSTNTSASGMFGVSTVAMGTMRSRIASTASS